MKLKTVLLASISSAVSMGGLLLIRKLFLDDHYNLIGPFLIMTSVCMIDRLCYGIAHGLIGKEQ